MKMQEEYLMMEKSLHKMNGLKKAESNLKKGLKMPVIMPDRKQTEIAPNKTF
jgi:hypothetical protein